MADGAGNQREILTISILTTYDNPEALSSAGAMEKAKTKCEMHSGFGFLLIHVYCLTG